MTARPSRGRTPTPRTKEIRASGRCVPQVFGAAAQACSGAPRGVCPSRGHAIDCHPADVQDRNRALKVIRGAKEKSPRMLQTRANGAYAGALVWSVVTTCICWLQITRRSDNVKGFVMQRWVGLLSARLAACREFGGSQRTTRCVRIQRFPGATLSCRDLCRDA